MFKNFFHKINSQSQSITSAAIIIGSLSLVSRFLGIFRDRILASQFGAGDILDAYYAAFRLPDFVYNILILGAVSAGLIPVFSALLAKKHEKEAWGLINDVLNLLSIGLLIACGILFIFAPVIVPFITPGFVGEKSALVIQLSRIMFLSPLLLGLSAIFSSVLQSFKKFFIYSLAPIFYNLGIIVGAVYFTKIWGVNGLAWGVVFGATIHFLIQLPSTFASGYRYKFSFNLKNTWVRNVLKMMVPRTFSLMVSQINFLMITVFASAMATGSLAIFNLSNNLQNFPLGIFGVSLAVAALPVMSELAAQKKNKEFVETISTTFRQILFFLIPASALLYVLRAQVVRVILGSGHFGWQDTRLTAACLAIFCIGLFAQGAYPLIIRGFYALHDTKTPFYISLFSMIANLASLFFFRWIFGFNNWFLFASTAILRITDMTGQVDFKVLALPFAIITSSIIELVILMFYLRRKIGRLDGYKITKSVAKIVLASFGAGLFAYASLQIMDTFVATEKFVGILGQGLVAGIIGLLGYWLIGYLLQMEEMSIFVSSFKKKMLKMTRLDQVELPTATNEENVS